MEANPIEPRSDTPRRRTNAWDLVIYLVCGFGLFTAAGIVVGYFWGSQTNSLLYSVMVFAFNLVFFGGTALVMGVGRGKFSLEEIGLCPPRWKWSWLGLAVALVVLLLPVRAGLGVLVEYLLRGNLDSLMLRSQLVQPVGADWLSFGVTLLFVGILVPFSEELFFRGAIYSWLRDRSPVWVSVLISAALFGLGHADSLGVVASSFVIGVVNALVFEKTRSIWVPVVIHAANNSLAIILVYLASALVKLMPGLAFLH
ncbi:predicted metal-dependent membrane protease [Longilinea arvoryzae]|uniref:Predicted metal-dependent membrane protease n=1 Tax=Longilinea arvoryzae TaxID=360412 RepID=A0A0S7BE32_9CHLR|nr:type II CAAX endopeptidase family protein [Longilinea arvoryzae]GAP13757.1 predicted metal-dependent membrane protease [Longilinea arvoryzae]